MKYADCAKEVSEVSINEMNVGNIFPANKDVGISSINYSYIVGDYFNHHLDLEAIKITESFGYPSAVITRCLQSGDLNHISATYNLLTL